MTDELKPSIVCLCGSTRFMDKFFEAGWQFTLGGWIVLSVGVCKHAEHHGAEALGANVAERLDELHLRKIDMADLVFVLNVDGYVGDSTEAEIEYAERMDKPVAYLENGHNDEMPTVEKIASWNRRTDSEEVRAARQNDEQKLIDAGEELAHIRLKPLADAALTFLSGDGEGAEVVHPGTDMTKLDVPTPTWESLCDAVDRYRARNVKVFKLNDYEWYAAETLESAVGEAVRMTGTPADEVVDNARELTEEEMDRLVFYDNMDDQEASETRTFREQLDRLIEMGTEFPIYFAGTEA